MPFTEDARRVFAAELTRHDHPTRLCHYFVSNYGIIHLRTEILAECSWVKCVEVDAVRWIADDDLTVIECTPNKQ